MSGIVTNEHRADLARQAVEAYLHRTRHNKREREAFAWDGEVFEEVVSDMLCDLMHLCDERGASFHALVGRGRMHYVAELEELACPDDPDGVHHVGCGCEEGVS